MSEPSKRLKIKVCGMRERDNIEALMSAPIDYIGFIFYDRSPRYVSGDLAWTEGVKRTGVFVDATLAYVQETIDRYSLTVVQLHGQESPSFCASFKRKGVEVVKSFLVDENFDFETTNSYEGKVDYFLFDTKTKDHGGSGKTFNWDLLSKYKGDTPFFLSGGLSEQNAEALQKISHERLYGLDINSRFELAPGVKDIPRITRFLENIHPLNIALK